MYFATLLERRDTEAQNMVAASNAGTRSIAYANEPGKADSLIQAGADAVTDSMAELARQ
ncbi:hypothetical protein [Nonomuraea sp. NPDC023979]|uniref:hypothetical protein n=1 Tax=Nonomuraea sp. NPDC023979 TaxID=3154796 RepID=UPI0033ECE284